jgi:hypothetical protein
MPKRYALWAATAVVAKTLKAQSKTIKQAMCMYNVAIPNIKHTVCSPNTKALNHYNV